MAQNIISNPGSNNLLRHKINTYIVLILISFANFISI